MPVVVTVLCFSHHACFLLWAKLTVELTCTSLPLNLYSSVFGCGCGFRFEQKFGRIDGFGEKKHGSARICIPLFSPLLSVQTTTISTDLYTGMASHVHLRKDFEKNSIQIPQFRDQSTSKQFSQFQARVRDIRFCIRK